MTPFNSTDRIATIALTPAEEAIVRAGDFLEVDTVDVTLVRSILVKLRHSLEVSDHPLGSGRWQQMKIKFIVEATVPAGATITEVKAFILEWARSGGGCRHPEDPLFHSLPDAIVRRAPPADARIDEAIEALKKIAYLRPGGPTNNKLAMKLERIAVDALRSLKAFNPPEK